MIPHAHIDPVWIWDWREGMREVLATFAAAADRLEHRPDLSFTASSSALYAWVEEQDPDLFERVRALVAAGRWSPAGGQWIEPDCNLPSGESLARQLLYGQRYLDRAFGRRATIAYNIDSFGHAASLPQLFRKAGLVGYVMMRPQHHEKELPSELFLWEGVDGTRLPTYRIPFGYNTGGHNGEPYDPMREARLVAERAPTLVARSRADGEPRMFLLGVSDHGGGPTTAGLKAVAQLGEAAEFAGPEAYFAAVAGRTSLPVVGGDLHPHAVGCYTAAGWIKAANARAEQALGAAEKLAALARWVTGRSVDMEDDLRTAWKRVLFNQFHDTLGGTCSEPAFQAVAAQYGHALSVADEVTTRAVQLMATRTDTWIEGAGGVERLQSLWPFAAHFPLPVVIFNPLGWGVRTPVVLPHPASRASLGSGAGVPLQPVSSREATRYDRHSLVMVDLPPLGHQVVWLHEPAEEAPPDAVSGGARATADGLENEHLTLVVDRARGVVSAVRSGEGGDWIEAEGIRPVVLDDPSDTWSHGVVRYDAEEQPCELVDARVVERGPVRALWRLTYRWDASLIYEDVALYQDLGYFDLVVRADWRQRRQLLKLVVPVGRAEPGVTAGLPYGAVAREESPGEEVMQHWLDVPCAPGGLVCCADLTYGYDLRDGRLRLTVLRSPRYADHGRPWAGDDAIDAPATDQGRHVASYRFLPHQGPCRPAESHRLAAEQGSTFPSVAETWHTGPLGQRGGGLEVASSTAVVSAVKRAESEEGWVLRLVETGGAGSRAAVRIPSLGRSWAGDVGPYEVKTLLVPDPAGSPVREVDLAEFDLPEPAGPAGGGPGSGSETG